MTAAIFLCLSVSVSAQQWTTATNSNDVKNTNAGNVGIGTSNPLNGKLQVNKSVRIDDDSGSAAGSDVAGGGPNLYIGTTGGGGLFQYNSGGGLDLWQYNGGWGHTVTFARSGSVGFGTTDPTFGGVVTSRLSIAQTDGITAFAVGNTSGVPRFALNIGSDGSWTMFDHGTGAWASGITQKGGSLGLGTTSPSNALHVNNSTGAQAIRVSGAGGGFMNFQDTSAAANQRLYQWRSEGGVFRMALVTDAENTFAQQNILVANSSGNVGLGTATPTTAKLVVAGSAGATGLDLSSTDQYAEMRVIRNSLGSGDKDLYLQYQAGAGSKIHLYGNNAETMTVSGGSVSVTGALSTTGAVTAGGAITGASINATYQDVAEWVPSAQKLSAGTVVVLDTERTNQVLASSKEYDTKVAGVVSARPGISLGEGGEGKALVATTGRVKVKVDATRAPIKVGDLLVTSDVEGVAMKSIPVDLGGTQIHRPGTIIGKALEPLASGTGEILVLLSLQ
jgi:hypothetical protein